MISELRSPDGAWTARTQLASYGGPGTASDIVTVELLRRTGAPIEVLSVSQNDARPDHVRVQWLGPHSLQIAVRVAQVDFQAVKAGGVSITTTEAP
jgi:hypothetical protein